jgi:hypothetical protein
MSRGRFEMELRIEGEAAEAVPKAPAKQIMRVIQEALSDARRHSGAENIRVSVEKCPKGNLLRAEVTDDGRGSLRCLVVGVSSMFLDKDLVSVRQAWDLVESARRAQKELACFDQDKIDHICEAMAWPTLREAGRLGAMAVEETGYGIPTDEEEKNRFAAEVAWERFRHLRTCGVIFESKSFVELAIPRGVLVGIVPSADPTSTAIFEALISIKSRNALVLSPHRSVARCTNETIRILREAAIEEGLPANALGCVTMATREGTEAPMEHEHTAMVLATDGTSDNISPLHLIDIKRVAFGITAVEGTLPSIGAAWELQ